MGAPAGASGTGTGSMANVFTPRQQGTADFDFWKMLDPLINAGAEGGAGTPAAQAYSYALPFTDTLARGWSDLPEGATGGGYLSKALGADYGVADYADTTLFPQTKSSATALNQTGTDTLGKAPDLYGAGRQVMDLGFDPLNTEYNRNRGQALDSASVANSMAGLSSSPFGASVTAASLNDFDSKWQDKRLERAGYGATTGGKLYTEAGVLGDMGASQLTSAEKLGSAGMFDTAKANQLEFNDLTSGVGSITKGQSAVSDLGTARYALPEDTLGSLESYLGLGQGASKISGQLGAMGQDQLGSSLQGIGSAVGTGSNLLFGGGGGGGGATAGLLSSGGIGGLFGGEAGALPAEVAATGGLWDAAAAAAPFAVSSDRRLKTDIRRLGKLANGLPVYTFRYRGKSQRHIGLMADDVERVYPEAVVTGPDGYKMVDYARATR